MPDAFVTPWTVARQAPLSIGFSKQECWTGLPFPSPGDLPNPGIEPTSPALEGGLFTAEPPGKPSQLSEQQFTCKAVGTSAMKRPSLRMVLAVRRNKTSRKGVTSLLERKLLPAKILAFLAQRSQMKKICRQFGGNREVAFILSWQRGEQSACASSTVPPTLPRGV